MVGFTEVERIAARKRWVVMKCDLSRQSLGGSVRRLKTFAIWVPSALAVARASGRLLFLALPLARYLSKRALQPAPRWERGWQWCKSIGRGFIAGGRGSR